MKLQQSRWRQAPGHCHQSQGRTGSWQATPHEQGGRLDLCQAGTCDWCLADKAGVCLEQWLTKQTQAAAEDALTRDRLTWELGPVMGAPAGSLVPVGSISRSPSVFWQPQLGVRQSQTRSSVGDGARPGTPGQGEICTLQGLPIALGFPQTLLGVPWGALRGHTQQTVPEMSARSRPGATGLLAVPVQRRMALSPGAAKKQWEGGAGSS